MSCQDRLVIASSGTVRLQVLIKARFKHECRIEHNGGLLSNVEVLHVLRDREADKQAVISKALPSEIKVKAMSGIAGC